MIHLRELREFLEWCGNQSPPVTLGEIVGVSQRPGAVLEIKAIHSDNEKLRTLVQIFNARPSKAK